MQGPQLRQGCGRWGVEETALLVLGIIAWFLDVAEVMSLTSQPIPRKLHSEATRRMWQLTVTATGARNGSNKRLQVGLTVSLHPQEGNLPCHSTQEGPRGQKLGLCTVGEVPSGHFREPGQQVQ